MRSRFVWLELFVGTVAYPDSSSSIFDGSEEMPSPWPSSAFGWTRFVWQTKTPVVVCMHLPWHLWWHKNCWRNCWDTEGRFKQYLPWTHKPLFPSTEAEHNWDGTHARIEQLHFYMYSFFDTLMRGVTNCPPWSERRLLLMDMYKWALRFDEIQVVYSNSFK